MATSRLLVTPEELSAEARKIQSTIPGYTNAYNEIYRDVDSLKSAGWWRGQANDSFASQINEFKKDYVALERLLAEDFQRALSVAGVDYNNTENTLVGDAKRLPTSSV